MAPIRPGDGDGHGDRVDECVGVFRQRELYNVWSFHT